MSDDAQTQEVLAAEAARCKATLEMDVDALKALLHEDYTHVTGGAGTMNRAQYLEWVVETPRKHERLDLKVKRFGDTAVIWGKLNNHMTEKGGGTRLIEAYVSQVVHRENGAWRFVSMQLTPKR
jgi:hypothetical protein